MKVLLAALVAITTTSIARADGFDCHTTTQDLNVKIYNYVDPSEGTRSASFMVLSDPSVGYGRKTIASFSDLKDTLSQEGSAFFADVDLRVSESNRSGENVGGTKLGHLKHVAVVVSHSYSNPVAEGTYLPGAIHFYKRNGEVSSQGLVCVRYLKH